MRMLKALAILFGLGAVANAEKKMMDNPLYAGWVKQKIGTTMTQNNVTEVAGQKTEAVTTYKLLELGKDKLVLEVTNKSKIMGMEFAGPPTKMEVEKTTTVEVDPKVVEEAEKKKKDYTTTNGEEKITIAGKEYKSKWTKIKGVIDGNVYESTTWHSDEIPGTILKMVSKNKGQSGSTTTTIEVTEFKVP
jgi:hypothetical protein